MAAAVAAVAFRDGEMAELERWLLLLALEPTWDELGGNLGSTWRKLVLIWDQLWANLEGT